MEDSEAIQRISKDLNLGSRADDYGDWGIINADYKRTSEFIAYYNDTRAENFDDCELIELIIASFEEALFKKYADTEMKNSFQEFIQWIVKEKVCPDTIEYWRKRSLGSKSHPLCAFLKNK